MTLAKIEISITQEWSHTLDTKARDQEIVDNASCMEIQCYRILKKTTDWTKNTR